MSKIIVAGGTGFIGTALIRKLLEEGYSVILLSRNPEKVVERRAGLSVEPWDARTTGK
jgi:uncharacterized protein YbjT (DUF2867 family)